MMKNIILASLITLTSVPALAYDYTYTEDDVHANGFETLYAGAGMGIVGGDAGDKCGDIVDCLSWKSFVGYRTGEHMAIEAGFHSILDTRSDSGTHPDQDVSALSLSLLGITSAKDLTFLDDYMHYVDFVPNYENMELFGKLGTAVWDSKVDGEVTVSCTDFLVGVGAQVKLGENLGARSEIEYIGGDVDSTNYGASLTYSTF